MSSLQRKGEIVMRQFRGKSITTGEWVEGHYWTDNVGDVPDGAIHYIQEYDQETLRAIKDHEVVPATIGQSTGLKDKNGVEVYSDQHLEDDKGNEYKIVWSSLFAAYWVVQCELPYKHFTAELIPKLEVIHDHPELTQ